MQKLPLADNESVLFTRLVRNVKFFASMNMGLLEKILNWITYYQFEKGESLCKQGDSGDSLYVLAEGKLSINVKKGSFSFSKKVAELGPGAIVGEMALINREKRTATVTCEEPSKVFVLLADHFDEAISQNPSLAEQIKKIVAERKFELEHQK